eukprot:568225-Pyramimonas_sp.AAC.1
MAARHTWKLEKADAVTAFLQGGNGRGEAEYLCGPPEGRTSGLRHERRRGLAISQAGVRVRTCPSQVVATLQTNAQGAAAGSDKVRAMRLGHPRQYYAGRH